MRTRHFAAVLALTVASLSLDATAATIGWNFGTTTGTVAATNGIPTHFIVSDFSLGNATSGTPLSTSSPSTTYAGASGQYNYTYAAHSGALDLSNSSYFQVTLTPFAGYTLNITDYDFGIRSTASGSTSYVVRSSLDSYASNLASGTITADLSWNLKNNDPFSISSTSAITLRLFTYGGSSAASGNLRLDDVAITATAASTPVPLPTVTIAAPLLLGLLALRRRTSPSA